MTQQFSSRNEAMAEVHAIGPGIYPSSDPNQETTVVLKIREGRRKAYFVRSEHDDGSYADYQVAPYWLFQSRDWGLAETVFVCQGEASGKRSLNWGLLRRGVWVDQPVSFARTGPR